MTQRWKLTIEYDGTAYHGWQYQEGLPSVQGVIENAIYQFCQQHIRIHVAGRTDAGVHATGQVAHFDLDYGSRPLEPYHFVKALNAYLRDTNVAVIKTEKVAPDFHARFQAKNKLYCYRILNRSAHAGIGANYVWHIRKKLDVKAMQKAAQHFLGEHDFTSVRSSDCQAKSPVRTLNRLEVIPLEDRSEIHILAEGRSFLQHQVRNMAGTLVEVGKNQRCPDSMPGLLIAKDRAAAGQTAPARGLCLARIDYDTK